MSVIIESYIIYIFIYKRLMTDYQHQVNSMTGAMGPTTPAYWATVGAAEGNPALLSNQPLMYNPVLGKYINTFDQNASWTPWALDKTVAGFGKNARLKKYLRYNKKEMAKSMSKSLSKFLKSLRKMVSSKKMGVHKKRHTSHKSRSHSARKSRSQFGHGKKHHHKKHFGGAKKSAGKRRKHRMGKRGRSFGIGQGRPDTFGMMGPF
jgi:hypothetical protein